MKRTLLCLAAASAIALGYALGAHAKPFSSKTVVSVKESSTSSIAAHFDVDKRSGLAGIRSEILDDYLGDVDVHDYGKSYTHSLIDGLSYDPDSGAAIYNEGGKSTVCGYFTDDWKESRKGIEDLLEENRGRLKKRFGADYVEFVKGDRKGERIYLKTHWDRPFFIPTGNCSFRVERKKRLVKHSAYKVKPVRVREVVLNVYRSSK